jgi:protein transport protein SEC61 subunit gamma-like protein
MQLKISETLQGYLRVLRVARKPTKDEFLSSAKVCGLGMGLIGLVGFLMFVVFRLLLGFV